MFSEKRFFIASVFLLILYSGYGQTFSNAGSWNTASNWSPASVPSGTGTNVTITADPTISSANVIGNVTDANSVDYTIEGTGSLTVGSTSTHKNMTFVNNGSITIATGGLLEIWGDLNVNNNLTIVMNGTLIVHGNITMANNGTIFISGAGAATVGGNLTGGQNSTIAATLGGSLKVTGALSLGGGTSSISATFGGTISAGSCSCSGCGAVFGCGSVPIKLLLFKVTTDDQGVKLNWSTSSELNFDYFVIERSADGSHFKDEAHVEGSGTTNVRKDYEYQDPFPLAGRSYYRLTTVDFDGYTETFNDNVVTVNLIATKNLQVLPNPITEGKLKLKVNFEITPDAEVGIYNSLGVLIARCPMSSEEMTIMLPDIESGVFLMKFFSSEFSAVKRFVVAN